MIKVQSMLVINESNSLMARNSGIPFDLCLGVIKFVKFIHIYKLYAKHFLHSLLEELLYLLLYRIIIWKNSGKESSIFYSKHSKYTSYKPSCHILSLNFF